MEQTFIKSLLEKGKDFKLRACYKEKELMWQIIQKYGLILIIIYAGVQMITNIKYHLDDLVEMQDIIVAENKWKIRIAAFEYYSKFYDFSAHWELDADFMEKIEQIPIKQEVYFSEQIPKWLVEYWFYPLTIQPTADVHVYFSFANTSPPSNHQIIFEDENGNCITMVREELQQIISDEELYKQWKPLFTNGE